MKRITIPKNKTYLRVVFVVLLFLAISLLHMGQSARHPNTVVLGNPGDHTAGIVYSSWVQPSSPLLGVTQMTNYPYGESLQQPLALSGIAPAGAHFLLTHIFNIVLAWNLLVLAGYMSSALSMYLFVRWLTKSTYAGVFAAYALTFTPYHAFASNGQIAGLLNAVFVLILWQFFVFWRSPSWKNSLILAGLFGVSFYTDGYFILIGLVTLLAFWTSIIVFSLLALAKHRPLADIKRRLILMLVASCATACFLLPLVWVKARYAQQIGSYLGATRGDIVVDAQTYSTDLIAYFKPSSLLFIGFSVLVLALVGLWFLWRKPKSVTKKQNGLTLDPWLVGLTLFFLSLISIWFSLRPTGKLWGLTIHNPSELIISLTPTWRVFGRLYTSASLGLATLAGVGLARLLELYPKKRILILGTVFIILIVELWSYPSLATPTFNYTKAPAVYGWLRNNPDIRAIAEYPLDEPPQGSYLSDYYTFQEISNKPLLNTFLPNSPQSGFRRSIAGINDPQTIPVLRALGIGLVNIRPGNPISHTPDTRRAALGNPNLRRIYSYGDSEHWVDSFLILPGVAAKHALTVPSLKYFQVSITTQGTAKYAIGDDTTLSIVNLTGSSGDTKQVSAIFEVSADADYVASIKQDGKELWSGVINQAPQELSLTADPRKPLVINNQKYDRLTRLFLSNLRVIEQSE